MIGCGNLHYDDSLQVPLSSIDQHSRQIGEEAARLTLAILKTKVPPKPEMVVLQPELIVRRSTQRRAGKTATSKGGSKADSEPAFSLQFENLLHQHPFLTGRRLGQRLLEFPH